MDIFTHLPPEIVYMILTYVTDIGDIYKISFVSKLWAQSVKSYISTINCNRQRQLPVSKIILFPKLCEVGGNIIVTVTHEQAHLLKLCPALTKLYIHIGAYSSYTQFYSTVLTLLTSLEISRKLATTKIRIMGTGHRIEAGFFLERHRFMFAEFGPHELLNPPGYWEQMRSIRNIFNLDKRLILYTHNQIILEYMVEADRMIATILNFVAEDYVPRLLRYKMKTFLMRANFGPHLTYYIHRLVGGGICSFSCLRKIVLIYVAYHRLRTHDRILLDPALQYLFPRTFTLSLKQFNIQIKDIGLLPMYPTIDIIDEYELPDEPLDAKTYRAICKIIDHTFSQH